MDNRSDCYRDNYDIHIITFEDVPLDKFLIVSSQFYFSEVQKISKTRKS